MIEYIFWRVNRLFCVANFLQKCKQLPGTGTENHLWSLPVKMSGKNEWGCKMASQDGVEAVLNVYIDSQYHDSKGITHYSYKNAFDDLMRPHHGLREAGCVDLESLDLPMNATFVLEGFHRGASRSFLEKSGFAMGVLAIVGLVTLNPVGAPVLTFALAAETGLLFTYMHNYVAAGYPRSMPRK